MLFPRLGCDIEVPALPIQSVPTNVPGLVHQFWKSDWFNSTGLKSAANILPGAMPQIIETVLTSFKHYSVTRAPYDAIRRHAIPQADSPSCEQIGQFSPVRTNQPVVRESLVYPECLAMPIGTCGANHRLSLAAQPLGVDFRIHTGREICYDRELSPSPHQLQFLDLVILTVPLHLGLDNLRLQAILVFDNGFDHRVHKLVGKEMGLQPEVK